jgi:hypothetical protein
MPVVGGLAGGAVGDAVGKSIYKLGKIVINGLVAVPIILITSVVAIVVGLTIFISFALLVINSGAYVVPPSSQLGGGGFVDYPSSTGDASCPIENPQIWQYSYQPGDENNATRHGTNAYWTRIVNNFCSAYPLPLRAPECFGPTGIVDNICSTQARTCPYYGRALDVAPLSGNNAVYAPSINGETITWTLTYVGGCISGSGCLREYTEPTGRYRLTLTHVDSAVESTVTSGSKLGVLTPQSGSFGDNTHLHLEFMVDGVWQRPEDWFCK